MGTDDVLGRFVWHELMTTDTKAAERFYTTVIGWTTQAWPQNPSYTMFLTGERPMAGLMDLPEDARAMGTPPNWLIYIGSPDVDATVHTAVSLGGSILVPPKDIPNVGRFAVLRDPQGAVFAVLTMTGVPPRADDAPPVGDFSWHELAATDWQTACAFYERLFGWKKTESMEMGPAGTYQMFGLDTRSIGGIFNKPPQMPGPPAWLPYIRVTDSKRAASLVAVSAGRIVNGPMEVPGGGWIAQGVDPQGAMFAVHSTRPMPRSTAARPAVRKKSKLKPKAKAAARSTTASKARARKSPGSRTRATKKTAPRKRVAKKTAPRRATSRRAAARTGTPRTRARSAAKRKRGRS